jgi:hypothetical protein
MLNLPDTNVVSLAMIARPNAVTFRAHIIEPSGASRKDFPGKFRGESHGEELPLKLFNQFTRPRS